jgi:hypothetical protein
VSDHAARCPAANELDSGVAPAQTDAIVTGQRYQKLESLEHRLPESDRSIIASCLS